MNTGESRVPQDGRFTVDYDGRWFDVRASSIPVLGSRIRPALLAALRPRARFGTARNGSRAAGKVSARFEAPGRVLRRGRPDRERQVDHVVRLAPDARFGTRQRLQRRGSGRVPHSRRGPNRRERTRRRDLPVALRALLRQNPQQLFFGEMRDAETVQIALQASLTGISLVTTLHARDALRVPARLAELGANRATLASALTLALSQRLLRMLCRRCKIGVQSRQQALAVSRRYGLAHGTQAWDARGCDSCAHTGFQGRSVRSRCSRSSPNSCRRSSAATRRRNSGASPDGIGYVRWSSTLCGTSPPASRRKAKSCATRTTTPISAMLADIEEAIADRARRRPVRQVVRPPHRGIEPPWSRVDGSMQRMDLAPIEPEAIRAFSKRISAKRNTTGSTACTEPRTGRSRIRAWGRSEFTPFVVRTGSHFRCDCCAKAFPNWAGSVCPQSSQPSQSFRTASCFSPGRPARASRPRLRH